MRALLLALLVLAAGCVAPGAEVAPQAGPALLAPAHEQSHEHADPALHVAARGLERIGAHTLAPENGPRGDWLTSEVIVVGDHAYVAYLGAPWLLAIVDVRDAAAPVLLSQLPTTNAWGMDLAVSDDGDWVYVAVYPAAVGELFAPGYLASHLAAPSGVAAPGIAVVDARDKAAPKLASFLPIHGFGPHTVGYHRYPDGREIVTAQKADARVGNSIAISEVVALPTGERALRPLALWWEEDLASVDMPHDVDIEEHPVTGQTLMYVAYTWNGMVIVDVTDPATPTTLARIGEGPMSDPDALVHDVHPYPILVDGRHFTVATPEIITGDTTGTMRIYDTTDPVEPALVGTWTMPGELVSDESFGFTMHNFVYMPDGRIALAHGHSGVWIVDWLPSRGEAPVATGYYARGFDDATAPAWSPVHGSPWFWGTGIDARGVLWASDTMGGLVSLRADA